MLPSNYPSTSHGQSSLTGFPNFSFLELQNADPNSPELFKQNLQLINEHVVRVQGLAQNALAGIQNAYHAGNTPAQTEANISTLKETLVILSEFLRQTGVGALPLVPDESKPLEPEQITTQTNVLFERLRRTQESAANVASLLGAGSEGGTRGGR